VEKLTEYEISEAELAVGRYFFYCKNRILPFGLLAAHRQKLKTIGPTKAKIS